MALGDITLLNDGAFGFNGTQKHKVASGAAGTILPGELVLKSLGSAYVITWDASNSAKPVVATDYVAGLAMSTSTDTAAADGYVEILPLIPGQVFLGNPKVAATWDTQAEYDALVGDRVLLDTTAAGVQTLLASDSATSGLVIMPLDITKYPGKVAFSIRAGASYLA
jgi:hypothetical protein